METLYGRTVGRIACSERRKEMLLKIWSDKNEGGEKKDGRYKRDSEQARGPNAEYAGGIRVTCTSMSERDVQRKSSEKFRVKVPKKSP